MTSRFTTLDPGWQWDDTAPLPQGKAYGNMVFVSGQIARHPDGHVVGVGDIRAQTRQVYANIASVLALAGLSLTDVIKLTTFVTDPRHLVGMWEVRREVFGDLAHHPATTSIAVSALADPELLIEVDAIAIKG